MGLFVIISYLLTFFELIILARVLLSWFPNIDHSNPLVKLLFDVTEPVLRPIRQMLPPTGMMDLSPLIVILIIQVVRVFLRV